MEKIVAGFGEPSDLHPITDSMLFGRSDYVRVKAKVNIGRRMVDRVKLRLPSSAGPATITAFINYDKIRKIFRFSGIMFRNAVECALRKHVVMRKEAKGESTQDVTFHVLGGWMTHAWLVPEEALVVREFRQESPLVTMFREHFARLGDCSIRRRHRVAEEQKHEAACGNSSSAGVVHSQLQHSVSTARAGALTRLKRHGGHVESRTADAPMQTAKVGGQSLPMNDQLELEAALSGLQVSRDGGRFRNQPDHR